MKLQETSIKWAINHIKKEKDTDLFPTLKEYEVDKEVFSEERIDNI